MNKKIIYLSVFLVLALFLISACKQYFDDSVGRKVVKNIVSADVPIGENIFGAGLLKQKLTKQDLSKFNSRESLEFYNNINIQSSLVGPFPDDDYKDRIVMTASADSIKFFYNLAGINLGSVSSSNPLRITFLGNKFNIVSINHASRFTLDNGQTYTDGDSYIGEDLDDPRWVWEVSGLTTTSAIIGIELDRNFRDGSDEPAIEVGKCISLPNSYANICLNSLVGDSNFNNVIIELAESVDLTSDSGVPGFTNANTIHIKSSSKFSPYLHRRDILTDEAWLAFDNWNLRLFYKDINSKKVDAGGMGPIQSSVEYALFDISNNNNNLIRWSGDSKSLNLILVDYNITESGRTTIPIKFSYNTNGFSALGITKSLEEANELQFCTSGAFCLNLGAKDENHRTKYGIIIKNPKINGASDMVELSIPAQQVKARVSVRALKSTQ